MRTKPAAGIDRARSADGGEEIGAGERGFDHVHLIGYLAEEDDVRAQRGCAAGRAEGRRGHVALPWRALAAMGAEGGVQRAVHVEQAAGAGALVEVVDILGDDEQLAGPCGVEPGQCIVGPDWTGRWRARRGGRRRRRAPVRDCGPSASGVQTSSTRWDAHSPSDARNVSRPLSAEIPAPVRMTSPRESGIGAVWTARAQGTQGP